MIAHGEQVFPRVKEKCSSKHWFSSEDIISLEELIGRLRRLKDNVGFIANRVTAIQAGLDSWQAEQINRKLYYLSFLSIIFLPLSIITGGKVVLQHKFSVAGFSEAFLYVSTVSKKLLTTSISVLLAVFGMNVGGVPWTGQKDPTLKDGFRNVMLLCVAMLLLALLCFSFPSLYTRIATWHRTRVMKRSWSLNRKSFLRRTHGIGVQERRGYLRI